MQGTVGFLESFVGRSPLPLGTFKRRSRIGSKLLKRVKFLLKVPSGTMTVSLGILDNGWTTWLVGPTAVTITTSWQRFKVTGMMTGGATSLWVAIGHYTDGWTSGQTFHAGGACLQQGNDPKKAYARTWGYQAGPVAAESRAGR